MGLPSCLKDISDALHNGKPIKIIGLGNSLTEGYLVGKGYLDFLAEKLIKRFPKALISIINAGISGDTAQDGLRRLHSDVIRHSPDLVLIEFGLNDAYLGVFPFEFQETLQRIIDILRAQTSAQLILLTSVCMPSYSETDFIQPFYDAINSLAELNRIPVARFHRLMQEQISLGFSFESMVMNDMVHPNEKGYNLMADAVMQLF